MIKLNETFRFLDAEAEHSAKHQSYLLGLGHKKLDSKGLMRSSNFKVFSFKDQVIS